MDIPDFDVSSTLEKKIFKEGLPPSHKIANRDAKAKLFRTTHHIKLQSNSLPNVSARNEFSPITSFDQLHKEPYAYAPKLLENMRSMAYHTPTPIQAQAIPIMDKHVSILACAPTGSGKTAAYLIPMLNQLFNETPDSFEDDMISQHTIRLFGLILAPTRELIQQIWSEAVRLSDGLSDAHFLARLGRRHYANRGKLCKKMVQLDGNKADKNALQLDKFKKPNDRELRLSRATRILIATPSRMSFLLSLPAGKCPFDLSHLSWLIIDECDKLLEVDISPKVRLSNRAHSFREQLKPILEAVQTSKISNDLPSFALFSATITQEVIDWADGELSTVSRNDASKMEHNRLPSLVHLRVGKRDTTVTTVTQELRYCATEEGKLLEIRCMILSGLLFPCLIFMESRERAKDVMKEILLSDTNLLVNSISSDKTEAQRSAIFNAFRTGKINVLVCTDLLGRGVDFKAVSMVVNYDMPSLKEDYIHRVGRTGRAGRRGKAVTFWTDADLPRLGNVLHVMRHSGSEVDPELERLVTNWEQRRSEVLKNTAPNNYSSLARVIGRRKRERRLIRSLLDTDDICPKKIKKHTKEYNDGTANQTEADKCKWLRPWNPYRKPINQLAASRTSQLEAINNSVCTKQRRRQR